MLEHLTLFTTKQADFLKFLKLKYHLYHLSNVFFRDLHYGVMAFLELNKIKSKYLEAEELTKKVIDSLEEANILKKVDKLTWVLHYAEFKKPATKPTPPAKPAAKPAAPAAAKPAATQATS
ncbi:MAG: hypothetical protein L0Y80_01570 [Ignavibacteriae bacterium]|nr:hypothetical protein [Ignavibacteriota bacterium]